MRIFISLVCLILFQSTALSQKIEYNIPEGYENEINKSDYKILVDFSANLIAKRYKIDFVKDGTIHLIKNGEISELNLHNLILKCSGEKDKSKWNAIIEDHFNSLFSSIDEQKKIDASNYESIKKYLSIRIYPEATITERGGTESIVTKKDLEGTYTLLMLDLPGSFVPVSRRNFDLWKKNIDEAFKTAQENINRQKIEKVSQKFKVDVDSIEICFLGNEDYAASYALDLGNNTPEFVGEWGCAIAIPNKGLVDICKISKDRPLDFVKFIQRTKSLVEKSYSEHPQPISTEYYWYYKGRFTLIHVVSDAKGNINVISPMGLSQLMTEKK